MICWDWTSSDGRRFLTTIRDGRRVLTLVREAGCWLPVQEPDEVIAEVEAVLGGGIGCTIERLS